MRFVTIDCMNDICNIVGFEHVYNLGVYLGTLLFHGRVGSRILNLLRTKLREAQWLGC